MKSAKKQVHIRKKIEINTLNAEELLALISSI